MRFPNATMDITYQVGTLSTSGTMVWTSRKQGKPGTYPGLSRDMDDIGFPNPSA